jgi:hypothetical protein
VRGSLRVAGFLQAAILLLAWPAAAQVRVGMLSNSLSGTIAPGYSADYGNMTGSDHSWILGGTASYSGFFYNPNFLSLNANVYVNQSRANSEFQSISNASGVTATANIFGGSHFPGSITYSKSYDQEGNYDVPGLSNYVTHGNSDVLAVNWNENLPDAPSFSAGFQMGSSQYSVYGANDQGDNLFHSLNLHSSYKLAGFNMGAFYSTGDAHSLIPQVVSGDQDTETHSDNSGEGFNISHQLPLNGSISAGVTRSDWSSDYLGNTSTGTIDLFSALASIHPTEKLSFSGSANYSDNLSGQLIESILAAGGAVPGLNSNEASDSFDLQGIGSYSPMPNLQTSAYVERRTQDFAGESYGVTSYGGGAGYSRPLLNGYFNSSLNVTANVADSTGEDTLGFSTNENYSSEILGWKVTGSFGYAQNVQTLLVTYMNSFYNYSGSVRRRWGNFTVSAGAGAGRTALTQQAGATSSSESYNVSVGYNPLISVTGTYTKASGQALETGAGLVPVPVPPPILPSGLISLYGGDGYSVGLSSSPVKKLLMSASYSRSTSNTSSTGFSSANQNNQFSSIIQYRVRKMSFNSGFARLEQGFSASGTPPEVISSYYIGVTRWFNFF